MKTLVWDRRSGPFQPQPAPDPAEAENTLGRRCRHLRNYPPVKQNLPSTLHPGFLPTEFSNLHLIRFNHIPFESIGDALEESNVDIATEFANLIVAQRSYEANARVITTFDQISQDTIALKQ